MSKRAIGSLVFLIAVGFAGYALFRYSSLRQRIPESIPEAQAAPILEAPLSGQQEMSSKPPSPRGESIQQITAEPERSLVAATSDQVNHIERYLPEGSQIARYAVSETEQKAALATADLNRSGQVETVVVYKAPEPEPEEGGQALFLGVLSAEGLAALPRCTKSTG